MTAKIDISPEQLAIVQGILCDHLPKGTLAWAFGSRVTWTAKPFSDLDIALEGAAPLAADVLIDLEEAFDSSDLPWKVDVIDLNTVSPEFRAIVERQRVPADMEPHTLGDVVDLLTGNPFKSAEYVEDSTSPKLLRGDNIVQGQLRWENVKRWPASKLDGLERYALSDGDIVLAMDRPWIEAGLKYARVGQADLPAYLVQRVARLRGTSRLRTDFLRYVIGSKAFTDHVLGVQTGTAVPHISANQIKSFELLLPPLALQAEIAKTLSALDDKIELNRRMNETLEAMARAVFRDWFVDFGPTRRKAAGLTDPAAILGGLLPDPTQAAPLAALFPDSFGENGLPEGWEERPFVGFLDIIGGGTPKTKIPEYWGGEVPWFSVVDTPSKGGVFVWNTEKTITERGVAESSVRMIDAGTTIISARGTVGNIAMAARPMTFNQSCYALRAVDPVGDIFVYLATERMVERLKAMAHGSVFSTITRATFESLNFAWAGEDVFAAFERLIEPMFDLIKANGQENQTLAATRDLLLPKLMSGEIRLTGAEGAA